MKLIYFDAGNPQKKKELEGLAKTAATISCPLPPCRPDKRSVIWRVFPDIGKRLARLIPPPRIGEDMLLFAQATADTIDPGAGAVKKEIGF